MKLSIMWSIAYILLYNYNMLMQLFKRSVMTYVALEGLIVVISSNLHHCKPRSAWSLHLCVHISINLCFKWPELPHGNHHLLTKLILYHYPAIIIVWMSKYSCHDRCEHCWRSNVKTFISIQNYSHIIHVCTNRGCHHYRNSREWY